MEILTHGLHYFLHSVVPHLKNGLTDHVVVKNNFIYSKGKNGGGLGLVNVYNCLKIASKIAKKVFVFIQQKILEKLVHLELIVQR